MSDRVFESGLTGRIGRRAALRAGALGAGGLAAAVLVGCSSDESGREPTATAGANGTGGTGTATGPGRLVQDPGVPYPYEFPEPAGDPKNGGVFVHATNFAFSPADPTVNTTGGTLIQFQPVYDRLLDYKRGPEADTTKVEVVPGLAESWERSPDGLTITFHLRGNVKWQNKPPVNGRPFTASDVKFAYDRMATQGATKPSFLGVTRVEAVDPKTVKVTLDQPLVDWLVATPPSRTIPIFPKETVDDGSIGTTIVGTSAFLVDRKEGERMTFVRNPDWWGAPPHVDGGEIRVMIDTAARVAAMRTRQVDHAGNVAVSAGDAKALADSIPGAQVQVSRVERGGQGIMLNLRNPKFADERVRRALSLGMNRPELTQIVDGGFGRSLGFFPWPFIFDKEPPADQLGRWMKYDPTQAKQLLDAAGVKDLVINEEHYNYSSVYEQSLGILANQWSQIGVTLKPTALESTSWTSKISTGKIDEAAFGMVVSIGATADVFAYEHLYSKSAGNRFTINDPTIDDLATRQRAELDPAKRRDLLRQIHDRDLDMMYRIPTPGRNSFFVLQPWVRNFRATGALGTLTDVWDAMAQMKQVWLNK